MKHEDDPLFDWLSRWPLERVPLADTWASVHTRFGFASQVACELETGLLMLVSQFQQVRESRLTFEDLLKYLETNGVLTLGRLVHLLDRLHKLPSETRETLDLGIRRRNFLIHHFYRHRAELFHSPDGCKKLEEELLAIQYDLSEAIEQLKIWADTVIGTRSNDEIRDDIREDIAKWRREQEAMLKAISGKNAI